MNEERKGASTDFSHGQWRRLFATPRDTRPEISRFYCKVKPISFKQASVVFQSRSQRSGSNARLLALVIRPVGILARYTPLNLSRSCFTFGLAAAKTELYAPTSISAIATRTNTFQNLAKGQLCEKVSTPPGCTANTVIGAGGSTISNLRCRDLVHMTLRSFE